MAFTEQDFIDACSELNIPNIEEWNLFTESHGVKIYRLYNEVFTVSHSSVQ